MENIMVINLEELLATCQKFVTDNEISCAETIYQTDRVVENSFAFIEAICDIVGYHEDEDE